MDLVSAEGRFPLQIYHCVYSLHTSVDWEDPLLVIFVIITRLMDYSAMVLINALEQSQGRS